MDIAVVTMVYNEPEYLPIWCRYYGAQVGPEHCYIIDHGTSDGTLEPYRALGFNILHIPRSPQDDTKRTRFISGLCSGLLEWYGAVLHCDVDEFIFPNPARYESLVDYVKQSTRKEPVNAIGFDLYQDMASEPDLDEQRAVMEQRAWVRFSSSMCKPVVAFAPIQWSPGFHSANAPVRFDDLFLIHLRYFDLKLGLRRLARTRAMAWASPSAGGHQRFGDEVLKGMMDNTIHMGRANLEELASTDPLIFEWTAKVLAVEQDFRTHMYPFDLHIFGDKLWRLPDSARLALANRGL